MVLNAHSKPPTDLRAIFKKYQKTSTEALELDENVFDSCKIKSKNTLPAPRLLDWKRESETLQLFETFLRSRDPQLANPTGPEASSNSVLGYEFDEIPGLCMFPALIPLGVQKTLLSRLFHRDLQDPDHQTNVHLHHNISYPTAGKSFFDFGPSTQSMAQPKDSSVHKPMTLGQFLDKKLRWMTLGGQYDWTNKIYPEGAHPQFPRDLSDLLHGLFPQTKPEAAIVNLYSPGDTLSLHRDVSEECDQGLISLSVGCDALFVVGLDSEAAGQDSEHMIMRLRSGDALYMTGSARYAWHGVPMILPDTCPEELRDWPHERESLSGHSPSEAYQKWCGWMASKRINLNVRQMKA